MGYINATTNMNGRTKTETTRKKMNKARKINGWMCPVCWDFYEHKKEVINCMNDCLEISEVEKSHLWECPECKERYSDKKDAEYCCKEKKDEYNE
jgi:hypothetical protein